MPLLWLKTTFKGGDNTLAPPGVGPAARVPLAPLGVDPVAPCWGQEQQCEI